ncbi:MAG: ABC transporter permease [Oligoflexia bacterium]|nr:ABC transporter permease [Oligoflexia bacterium]
MAELVAKTMVVLKPFEFLGVSLIAFYKELKNMLLYFFDVLYALFTPPFRGKETMQQLYFIGVKSAPIILFSLSLAASVAILEYAYHMRLVLHTAALVPGFVSLLILRELGPVITGLLLTSRIGAGITAELGTMQITEQIDALKLLSVEPVRYLVIPRFIASIFASMALVVLGNATCLFFGMLVSISHLDVTMGSFISAVNQFAGFKDFTLAIVKAGVFGSVIPIISCYYGFNCKPGAEGVGTATTQSVVANAVTIIILDFILTYLFSYLY